MSYEKDQIAKKERRERIAVRCLQGMMRNGECWERTMLEPITGENGSGLWPRPTVSGNYNRKGASKTSGDGLATAVRMLPTPVASMSRGSSRNALTRKDGSSRVNDRLDHYIFNQTGGRLNPTWVEWLMGWPLGWTDLQLLATDKYQRWLQSHLNSC